MSKCIGTFFVFEAKQRFVVVLKYILFCQCCRLLTRKTYEMQMFHMSSLKMGLDQAVLKGFESGATGEVSTVDFSSAPADLLHV